MALTNNPYSTSRAEQILESMIDGSEYSGEPQTRLEKLLLQLGPGGGGGAGGGDMDLEDIDDIMSDISKDNGQIGPRERGDD